MDWSGKQVVKAVPAGRIQQSNEKRDPGCLGLYRGWNTAHPKTMNNEGFNPWK